MGTPLSRWHRRPMLAHLMYIIIQYVVINSASNTTSRIHFKMIMSFSGFAALIDFVATEGSEVCRFRGFGQRQKCRFRGKNQEYLW